MPHEQADVDGPLHVLSESADGTRDDHAPIMLIHGLDGSAANWVDVLGPLARHGPVTAPDLPGFGRSPLAGRDVSMAASADLVARMLTTRGQGPAIVMGNSMGGPVALLTAARHPELVHAVVLVAPALPRAGSLPWAGSFAPFLLPYAVPGLMRAEPRRRASQPPARRVRGLLELCYAPGRHESPEAFAEMVEVARQRDAGDASTAWVGASRSLFGWLFRRRAFHRMADRVAAPVLIIDGAADPIIPTSSVTACLERHPAWQRSSLPDVGHVPQLEDPAGFVAAVASFVDGLDPVGHLT